MKTVKVAKLREQIANAELDDARKQELLAIVGDIDDDEKHETLRERLLAFETAHPALSSLISRVAETLSELGI